MPGRAWIGTSGWNYPHWGEGVFYPPGLPAADWLSFYARRFPTVEVNNTFYRLPTQDLCRRWAAAAPEGFVFAVKVPGLFTHRFRLAAPPDLLARFLEAVSPLGEKLGPLLVQLPPRARADPAHLDGFLALLIGEAEARGLPVRVACEFRHESWFAADVLAALARHGVALCLADWPWSEGFPPAALAGAAARGEPAAPDGTKVPGTPSATLIGGCAGRDPVTSRPFLYVRRHGPGGCYTPEELTGLARLARANLEAGADVYVYFNNDACGWAVANAAALLALLPETRAPTGGHAQARTTQARAAQSKAAPRDVSPS